MMDVAEVQVGSTITNGSSALRITERVERDPRWGTPSWKGVCIPLEEFGGNPGMTDTVPDYLLGSWSHVPFEWRPVTGGGLEERYIWTPDWRRLQREVRVNFPRKPCEKADEAGHKAGHEWQELHIPTGNPLVEHSQWWRCETRQPEPVPAPVQVPVDCRPEHGVGHPDCPKCWAWSDRNPNARPRPEVSR